MVCAVQSLVHLVTQTMPWLSHFLRKTTSDYNNSCTSTEARDNPKYVLLKCTTDVCLLLSRQICYVVDQRHILLFQLPVLPCHQACQENKRNLFLQAIKACAVTSSIVDTNVLFFQFLLGLLYLLWN